MLDTQQFTLQNLRMQKSMRGKLIIGMMMAVIALVFGTMIALDRFRQSITPVYLLLMGLLLLACLILPILLWNFPRFGFFLLFGFMTLVNADPRALNRHKLTANLPFFLGLNNVGDQYGIGGLQPFKFSPAEVIIMLTFLVWLVRAISSRTLRFERGPFLGCLLLYAITTAIGFIHGWATGGDPVMALWEVRAQFYPLMMYVLACNLFTERKHIIQLLWVALIGLGLLSLVGTISYFQLGGVVGEQGILDHEDSLVLNAFIFLLMFLHVNGGSRKMIWTSYLFLPFVVFTILENNRRAGIAAFVIAFAASLPMMWFLFTEQRKRVGIFIGTFGVIAAIYLPLAWNGQGAWALPARAIKSNTAPDTRDQGSDVYRIMEDADLKATRDTSPLIGFGYGKPYLQPYPLPAVTTDFLKFFAHNSILWVWMRTGHLGFFALLFFIATICIRGLQICRAVRDPELLAIGMMGVIFVLMCFVFGKYDLQLANYRTMMMMGVWIGALGVLPRLTAESQAATPETPRESLDSLDDEEFPVVELPGFVRGNAQ